MNEMEKRLKKAVKHFWATRESQALKQGGATGAKDQGFRAAVTGGKQMDGFVNLVLVLLCDAGIEEACVYCERNLEVPGYYRPEKRWDLIVVADETLLASIEFKSQVGPSFGNNFNNRTEEALGSATDLWAAYREGAFRESQRPWLGYLMLLEDSPGSTTPVGVREPHFTVFEEFRGSSYEKRYEILLTKLVRERLYDAACFLTSDRDRGLKGDYREPSAELSFRNFVASLLAKAIAYAKSRQ
jgi:hypothetical protein